MPWGFAEWFAISQTALPAILILPGTQSVRLPIRISAFAISLAAFAWYTLSPKMKLRQSHAQSWVFAVMALLTGVLGGGSLDAMCSMSSASPLSGMVPMYLLMSAFHLAPWLKLISGRT